MPKTLHTHKVVKIKDRKPFIPKSPMNKLMPMVTNYLHTRNHQGFLTYTGFWSKIDTVNPEYK